MSNWCGVRDAACPLSTEGGGGGYARKEDEAVGAEAVDALAREAAR